jgi:hypothetical protein
MLQGNVTPTPNAIDGGDSLPIRPSRKPNDGAPQYDGTVRRNAERLLLSIEQIASFRGKKRGGEGRLRTQQSMEDIDLTQSSIYDAQDRIDEDNDLEQHQKRRVRISLKDAEKYASQIILRSKRNLRAVSRRDLSPESAELSDESSIRQKGSQDERSIAQQNRKRTCIVIGVMTLLTAVIVTAVVLPAQMSRPEQRQTNSFPPKKRR